MNTIVSEAKASPQGQKAVGCLLELCHRLNLIPIPLKPKSKIPLVRWSEKHWRPSPAELEPWASKPGINWGVRCGAELAVLDFDEPGAYHRFVQEHPEAASWPRVKTGRGHHLWLKPTKPMRSQRVNGVEIKCLGSYVVAPPSVHPTGALYSFEIPPDGTLPEVDLERLLVLNENHSTIPPIPDKPSIGKTEGWVTTTEQQKTFRTLFSIVGVHPGQNPTWCPWHPDREGLPGRIPQESLSVDRNRCLFKCHSPRCGERGGLERLGDLALGQGCSNYPMYTGSAKNNSDIPIPEAPPWNQWELEEPPTKHCGLPIHLRHKHRRELQRIIGVLCGRWDCGTCGPYLKGKWWRHLTHHIMNEESVYLATISNGKWTTIYRRIRRAGGEFAKIELADGSLVIFTTAKEGTSLPASLREEVLRAAIDSATFKHRAISTSRGWALLKKNQRDSDWERVNLLPGTVNDARQVVRQLGLAPKELSVEQLGWMKGVKEGFEIKLPDSWLDDDELGYRVFVQWLNYGPIKAWDDPPVVSVSG